MPLSFAGPRALSTTRTGRGVRRVRLGTALDKLASIPHRNASVQNIDSHFASPTIHMIHLIEGKVFRTSEGEEFGIIRKCHDHGPEELQTAGWVPFAENGCGDFFVRRSENFAFWDHETSEILLLAVGEERFLAGIADPSPVEIKPGQVKKVWIDSAFACEWESLEDRTDEGN